MYIPMISGFTDFCIFHSSGSPIYVVDGILRAGFDLAVGIKHKYDFIFAESKKEIEDAIRANLYMFNIVPENSFYYPNTNMFSYPSKINNIKGYVLTLKPEYRSRRY